MLNDFASIARDTATFRFLAFAGLVLIMFSAFMFGNAKATKDWLPAEAVVSKAELVEPQGTGKTNSEAGYRTTVRYFVDGKEYETLYGEFPKPEEGKVVKILYDPKNPDSIAQDGNGTTSAVCVLVAGIVSILGAFVSLATALKKRKVLRKQEEEWNWR